MAKEKVMEPEIETEEIYEEEAFTPEIETEPKATKKKITVKSVLKKIGTGVGLGLLAGAAYMLGKNQGRRETEEEAVKYLEAEPETEVIEVTEF